MARNVLLLLLSNKHLDEIWFMFSVEKHKIMPSKRSLIDTFRDVQEELVYFSSWPFRGIKIFVKCADYWGLVVQRIV